jgi:hypothetical protein
MGVPETSVDKYQFYQFAQPAKHDVRFGGWPALPQTGVPLPSFARAGIHNRLHRDRRCRLSSTKLQQCPRDCDASTRPDKRTSSPSAVIDGSRSLRPPGRGSFWQARYYDFNVWSEKKRIEKLRYIHRNPVRRGLVEKPEDWKWSSFRHYPTGADGVVEIESEWTAHKRERMGLRPIVRIGPVIQFRPSKARKRHPCSL